MDLKYILLSILSGGVLKVYDDLSDNHLLEDYKQKEYVYEFLKSLFFITFTILSLNFPLFYICIMLIFIAGFIFDNKAYSDPFEFTGLITLCFIFAFLDFSKINLQYKDSILILLCIVLYIFVDVLPTKNIEYSKKKLYTRAFSLGLIIAIAIFNRYYHFITNDFLITLYCFAGYVTVSCIFQYLLLNKILKPE